MANEDQVKILKEKGVKAWNEWREANPNNRPDLSEADFSEVFLIGANLTNTNLSKAQLCGIRLRQSDLRRADLHEANLSGADLKSTRLGDVNFSRASLERVDLSSADLTMAKLIGADLSMSKLIGSNLGWANLTEADFTDCTMTGVQLGNVDLSQTKGLETVGHLGPSTIGIDTIYRSGGKIPEVFLRGTGVPEPFIVQMKSLVSAMSPIEFYSCFISYSSKDQELLTGCMPTCKTRVSGAGLHRKT